MAAVMEAEVEVVGAGGGAVGTQEESKGCVVSPDK